MGTPEFSVPSLEILIENGYNIVAVVTAPDRPKGRGQQLSTSAVKDCATKNNIPVLQPTNLKSEAFISELKSYNANLQIVVAFRMLPEVVWDMPAIGTFNLHGSLLPQYRGAAPINWAIMNGEKETGVTTFFLKHQIDTGNIVFQEKESILEEDNVGTVYERLMLKGAQLVLKTVQAIENDNYPLKAQDETGEIKHAPKIFKETCEINWSESSDKIYDFIRGLSPYPAAWTTINGNSCKIFKAKKISSSLNAGEVSSDNKTYLRIGANDGALNILELQMQGKKRMGIEDFLRGNKI